MIRVASPRPPSAVQLRSCGGTTASSSSACPSFRGSGCRVAATSGSRRRRRNAISCCSSEDREGARGAAPPTPAPTAAPSDGSIQLYSQIERVITEAAKQSSEGWGSTGDWTEIEGAWVLRPKSSDPSFVVHFIGGIFVGAAPQVTYRFFLERLAEKGALVIATPYASGFDHFYIADDVQFKFDRCLRNLVEPVNDLPTFGVGHSLGSLIHLLIGSRYAVQRSGNVLMAFNNKEASLAIPLFSPVIVPMAQSFGPILSQLTSSPTIRFGAEAAIKQLENLGPPVVKQLLPLLQQLPPLYMDLVEGREDFIPKPEETRRLQNPVEEVHPPQEVLSADDHSMVSSASVFVGNFEPADEVMQDVPLDVHGNVVAQVDPVEVPDMGNNVVELPLVAAPVVVENVLGAQNVVAAVEEVQNDVALVANFQAAADIHDTVDGNPLDDSQPLPAQEYVVRVSGPAVLNLVAQEDLALVRVEENLSAEVPSPLVPVPEANSAAVSVDISAAPLSITAHGLGSVQTATTAQLEASEGPVMESTFSKDLVSQPVSSNLSPFAEVDVARSSEFQNESALKRNWDSAFLISNKSQPTATPLLVRKKVVVSRGSCNPSESTALFDNVVFQAQPLSDQKKRGRSRKAPTPVVVPATDRITRSKSALKGHRAPPIQSLVPRSRKKSKKMAPGQDRAQQPAATSSEIPPPTPVKALQQIGSLLQIDPSELTVEKLGATPLADAVCNKGSQ